MSAGILIHAPRKGSDLLTISGLRTYAQFLSTLPAMGATAQKWVDKLTFGISIHAPREGSD